MPSFPLYLRACAVLGDGLTFTFTADSGAAPLAGMIGGAPVHVGDPSRIGIADVHKPDWGEPVTFMSGEEPVFWACGVTPQAVALEARPPLCITHAPAHMFITDLPDHTLSVL